MSGRDEYGRFLRGPDWLNLPASCHSPRWAEGSAARRPISGAVAYAAHCSRALLNRSTPWESVQAQCQAKLDAARGIRRTGRGIRVILKPLSEDQSRLLRFFRLVRDPRTYDQSRQWFEQRVSPYVLLIPVSDQLKDELPT